MDVAAPKLASYVISIAQSLRWEKCRLSLDSIAVVYASSSMAKHVLDVSSEGRIGVDVFAKLACTDAELHCQTEDVDKLVTSMADEVGAENAVAATIDNDLRPGDGFGVGPG